MATRFDDWEGQFLQHHGIKGQKWGVRRYQNEDGTLTALGKLRGGSEARKDNRVLKKAIRDQKKLSAEWNKDRETSKKRAIKDDNYRKTIANLEAHRLKMDPKETEELMDASLAAEHVADILSWYKYGDRSHRNIVTKIEKGEKIAKTILRKLEKRGVNIEENGKRWASKLEEERGEQQSGRNAFEGKSAEYVLGLLQAQREIEKRRKRR